jgi:hypothetical protein
MDDSGNIFRFPEGQAVPRGLTPLTEGEAVELLKHPHRRRKLLLK